MAVTKPKLIVSRYLAGVIAACVFANILFATDSRAAVLPEDRADVMTHYYNGGGLTVSGPAVLVRKGFDDTVSVRMNYYVDNITSASIDVVTTASEYNEYRAETSAGVDYLYDNTILNIGFTKSDENDYNALTYNFGVVQEVFGGMTTVTMGYAHGDDIVRKSTDVFFEEEIARDQYSLGVSQVLTKHFIVSGSYEAITEQGFLNNPYRTYRHETSTPNELGAKLEQYPETRRSHAFSLTGKHYLMTEGSVLGRYRYFTDTWGITAHDVEVGYSQYLGDQSWILDAHIRYYTQSKADFYQDIFQETNTQIYKARDKELSTFNSYGVGASIAYKFLDEGWEFIDKGSAHLSVEYLQFNYDDFSDLREEKSTFMESYVLKAYVIEAFISLWY